MQRETIESALRRVQLGELSPSEATQWLLRLDAGEPLPAPATAAALSADAPSRIMSIAIRSIAIRPGCRRTNRSRH